ncbi:hypothetical protein BBN02_20485 [Vibrio parahaemolyticus]|uniref:DUF4365 domain-containing protein n=1 Tax=Vibrio parahaemolyticus TaxID=670 RepID=UPI00084B1401|nr:DUF4365 domain-containing protein [Vibrio parahaemolyticus]ODZ32689.1 hypothetical protein BBN02_20485 [Vibrio parahaemolyticus]
MKYIMRNESSIIGDIAENDIKALCARLGWAVEKVQNDYGEDLLIQTKEYERMDPFKIWIQVKGTTDFETKRTKNGNISQSVAKGNMWKWLRSRELCVLIVWDINETKGVYSIIKDDVDPFDIYKTDCDSMTVSIDGNAHVSLDALNKICWQARLEYYESVIAMSRVECEVSGGQQESSSPLSRKFLLVSEYLHSVGVIAHFGSEKHILLTDTCQAYFSNGLINWQREHPDDSEYDSRGSVVALMIINRVREVTELNISQSLLMDCMEFFEHFGRSFDRNEHTYT